MSARDELPPGWEYTTAPSNEAVARGPVGLSAWTAAPGHRQCAKDAWRLWSRASGITREELATMRAAVERDREAWEACKFVSKQIGEAPEGAAETIRTLWAANEHLAEQSLPADVAKLRAAVERCAELEAEFAKVTAERNEARRIAGQHRDAHESDTERRGGAPMRVRHPWERAKPTEGQ